MAYKTLLYEFAEAKKFSQKAFGLTLFLGIVFVLAFLLFYELLYRKDISVSNKLPHQLTDIIFVTPSVFPTPFFSPTPIIPITPVPTHAVTPQPIRQVITFEEVGYGSKLNGEYPLGVVEWQKNTWVVIKPLLAFNTKNISFSSPQRVIGKFTFLQPKKLVSFKALNHGKKEGILSVSCKGQPDVESALKPNEVITIQTNWEKECAIVTIKSAIAWYIHFDDFEIE